MEGAPQVRLLPSPSSSGSPTYNLAHTAQAPQSSICCPNLAAVGLNSTSSALVQTGAVLLVRHSFHRGVLLARSSSFRGPLTHSCSPPLVGVFRGPAVASNSTATLFRMSVP